MAILLPCNDMIVLPWTPCELGPRDALPLVICSRHSLHAAPELRLRHLGSSGIESVTSGLRPAGPNFNTCHKHWQRQYIDDRTVSSDFGPTYSNRAVSAAGPRASSKPPNTACRLLYTPLAQQDTGVWGLRPSSARRSGDRNSRRMSRKSPICRFRSTSIV